MNEQLTELLANYKDGVPVKIKKENLILIAAVAILVVAVSAGVVKIINNL